MLGSQTLDVAIGMAFVYLLLSAIVSAINEAIQSWTKLRARTLEDGIRELLNEPAGATATAATQAFYQQPLIMALFKGKYSTQSKSLPSYIPAEAFARTLMQVVFPAALPAKNVAALRDAIHALAGPYEGIKPALLALAVDTEGDLQKFRCNLEKWFNAAMDRVGGWYKKHVQWWLLGIAIIVVVAGNVDSLALIDTLWTDSAARSTAVQAAVAAAKTTPSSGASQQPLDQAKTSISTLRSLIGLPLGWENAGPFNLNRVLGWLLTILAITLGAPFWFDLLNRLVELRSSNKPKETGPPAQPAGAGGAR